LFTENFTERITFEMDVEPNNPPSELKGPLQKLIVACIQLFIFHSSFLT